MMNEFYLQKIWQIQYFDKKDLFTNCGKSIMVYFPGTINENAGPDFLNARLRIGETEWAGSIELHIRTSDWFRHEHQYDKLYLNVILHVVWINDVDIFSQSPILSLENRMIQLGKKLLHTIIDSNETIPCSPYFRSNHFTSEIRNIFLKARLQRKYLTILDYFKNSNYDWEEICWILVCRNMGYSVNEDFFEKLAKALPYKLLKKYIHDPLSIDALLFGMAGLLEGDFIDEYPRALKVHFERLKSFHSLVSSISALKFLRMRPMNFPTIRLAQLSSILTNSPLIWKTLIYSEDLNDLKKYIQYELNPYWNTHYLFDRPSAYASKIIGESLFNNIIINTIIPIKIAKSFIVNKQQALSDGIGMLKMIKPESNKIIQYFTQNGIQPKSAADSQAILELFNKYCTNKKCIHCAISYEITKDRLP